jgi:hypothetical protein
MTAVEPSRYFLTYHEERRDRFLIVAVRVPLPAGRSFALEPTAGVVLTFPQASSLAEYTGPFPPPTPSPRVQHQLATGFGPAFGLDARIGGGRVAVVPSFRMLHSNVSKGQYDNLVTSPEVEIGSIYPGGYPKWTVYSSVALRVQL